MVLFGPPGILFTAEKFSIGIIEIAPTISLTS